MAKNYIDIEVKVWKRFYFDSEETYLKMKNIFLDESKSDDYLLDECYENSYDTETIADTELVCEATKSDATVEFYDNDFLILSNGYKSDEK